jgi:hypothetical protein
MIKYFLIIALLLYSFFIEAQVFTSDLPIVVINPNGQTIEGDPKKLCNFGVIDNNNQINTSTDPLNSFSGIAGVLRLEGILLRDSKRNHKQFNYGVMIV